MIKLKKFSDSKSSAIDWINEYYMEQDDADQIAAGMAKDLIRHGMDYYDDEIERVILEAPEEAAGYKDTVDKAKRVAKEALSKTKNLK